MSLVNIAITSIRLYLAGVARAVRELAWVDVARVVRKPRLAVAFSRVIAGAEKDDDDDDDDDDKDKVTMSKAEADRLKRKAAEGDKKTKKLQGEIDDLREQIEDHETGDDEVEKLKKRVERAERRAEKAEGERDEAQGEVTKTKQERTVTDVARRLGFKSPHLAHRLISSDDAESEGAAESALKEVLNESPELGGAKGKPQREVGRKASRDNGDQADDENGDRGKGKREDEGKITRDGARRKLEDHYASTSASQDKGDESSDE